MGVEVTFSLIGNSYLLVSKIINGAHGEAYN